MENIGMYTGREKRTCLGEEKTLMLYALEGEKAERG
jgi:hypothetical protein